MLMVRSSVRDVPRPRALFLLEGKKGDNTAVCIACFFIVFIPPIRFYPHLSCATLCEPPLLHVFASEASRQLQVSAICAYPTSWKIKAKSRSASGCAPKITYSAARSYAARRT